MMTERVDSAILQILDDITMHAGADVLRAHLQRCSRQKLEVWQDARGLDLLHHAILENSYVVAGTLFAHGVFKPPHEPSAPWSYVHMAAALGYRTILSLLLQERPYDNKKVELDWVTFKRTVIPKLNVSKNGPTVLPTTDEERSSPVWPVDVAARFGHLACVKHILDFHMLKDSAPGMGTPARRNATAGYLNAACRLDSPFALRLLLTEADAEGEDVRSALDVALKMARPECVDTLLRHGVDIKRLFGGMNLFHVLFAYTKGFQHQAPASLDDSLVTLTSVLLRQGCDVNACRPSRTYPLYSLLRCTRIADMETSAPVVLAALLLLLQAGADPNFDELVVEEAVRDEEHTTAFGRQPFSSALHCVMDAAVNYAEEVTDPENVSRYMYKCCEVLLRHGADASYIGKYRSPQGVVRCGNVLHVFAEASALLRNVDRACLLLLLRHGARPDARVDGSYPLTSYLDVIVLQPRGGPPSRSRVSASAEHPDAAPTHDRRGTPTCCEAAQDSDVAAKVKRMCRMLRFMNHSALLDCERIIRERIGVLEQSRSEASAPGQARLGERSACWELGLQEVEKCTHAVTSLRRVCALVAWKACRYHVGNVYKLPIPNALASVLLGQL